MRPGPDETGGGRGTSLVEQAFTVLALFIFSRALIFHTVPAMSKVAAAGLPLSNEMTGAISHSNLLWAYITVYCVTGLLMLSKVREVICFLYREKFLFLLLLLSALSSLWSVVPYETFAKTAAMAACSLFGLYLAMRYSLTQQLQLLGCTLCLIIIASIAIALLSPEIGIMSGTHEGLWRGAFVHKNMLGTTLPIGSIAFFLLAATPSNRTLFYWSGFILSVFLLLMSCSKSSLLTFCSIFLALAIYLAIKRQGTLVVAALTSVAICASALGLQYKWHIYPPIVLANLTSAASESNTAEHPGAASGRGSFWRDVESSAPHSASLDTGIARVELWQLVWREIEKRPLLGYGMGGFWLGLDGPSGDIWRLERWHPPDSHNGFLDLWLQLGIAGLALFLLSFCTACRLAIRPLLTAPFSPEKMLVPALLGYIFLANLGESDLFSTNYILWILFVSAAACAREYKRPEYEAVCA